MPETSVHLSHQTEATYRDISQLNVTFSTGSGRSRVAGKAPDSALPDPEGPALRIHSGQGGYFIFERFYRLAGTCTVKARNITHCEVQEP